MIKQWLFIWLCITSAWMAEAQSVYQKVNAIVPEEEIQRWATQKFGAELVLSDVKESPAGKHYLFSQTYKGVIVHNGGLKINVGQQGRVYAVMNFLQPIETANAPVFILTKAEAIQHIQQQIETTQITVYPVWWQQNQTWKCAYLAIVHTHSNPPRQVWVLDALTGEVIQVESGVANHNTHRDTTGTGLVFRPDPITASHSTYGTMFSDNANMYVSAFDPYVYPVTLKNIDYDTIAHVFRLIGPYVKLENIHPFDSLPVTSPNGQFLYMRNRSGFEDVMVYYHIDSFQRYVQRLGFANLYNHPLRVDPHGNYNSDNSFFSADSLNSYIAFGEGGVDDAEDADVIIHEYGHALSYAAAPYLTMGGGDRKGIDEGIGDYFAAGYSFDIDTYAWEQLFNWDGHNTFWAGRNAACTLTYPLATSNIYSKGEVWASTLMQIRQAIGAETADKLCLAELYHNVPNMTMPDAAHIYMDMDSIFFGGVHQSIIRSFFCNRGIFSGVECTIDIETPQQAMPFSIYPNPSSGDFYIQTHRPVPTQIQIFDAIGNRVVNMQVFDNEHISVSLPAGIYRLVANNYSQNLLIK